MPGNSCADFVQMRAGPMLIDRMVGSDLNVAVKEEVEFVDRYDGFVVRVDGPRYVSSSGIIHGLSGM